MTDVLLLGLVLLLLVLAALAVMAESAITRTNRVRAIHLVEQGRRGARRLLSIVEDPSPYMNVLLLTRIALQVTATALAAVAATRRFDAAGEVAVIAAVTIAMFVVVEAVPRTYGVQATDRAALIMAGPVSFLGRMLRPVGRLLILLTNAVMVPLPGRGLPKGPFITEEEIREMVDVAAEDSKAIEEEERELIHSIFEFGDTVVREVMVPRPDMITVRSDAGLNEALEAVLGAGYSRIPIYQGDIDNIVGVLYAKDLLKRIHEAGGEAKVESLGRAPFFVPEQKKVAELLREMQEQRVHMAIVVDEYGGTAGLVTIEDLIEEIVGEIVDEYDQEEPLVEPLDETTIRVDAKMAIDEVNELLDADLPHEEWDTVGGLVFGLTGRVPSPGETVRYDSLEFKTERVAGRRIQKVVISKLPDAGTRE
jgi:CBS domain containing-hemolysin-like protein